MNPLEQGEATIRGPLSSWVRKNSMSLSTLLLKVFISSREGMQHKVKRGTSRRWAGRGVAGGSARGVGCARHLKAEEFARELRKNITEFSTPGAIRESKAHPAFRRNCLTSAIRKTNEESTKSSA